MPPPFHHPNASRSSHTATLVGNSIYVIGREGNRPRARSRNLFFLDLATFCWSLQKAHVTPRAGHCTALIRPGQLAVYGGRSGTDVDLVSVPYSPGERPDWGAMHQALPLPLAPSKVRV